MLKNWTINNTPSESETAEEKEPEQLDRCSVGYGSILYFALEDE